MRLLVLAVCAASGAAACTGLIGGDETEGVGGPDTPTVDALGPTPLRRLTRAQYDKTVRDLLGAPEGAASSFAPDEQVGAFHSNAVAPVSELTVEQYMAAAESLAQQAVTDLTALLPCQPAVSGEDACADEFIEYFGTRAYRRPLDETELAQLRTVYQVGKSTSFADGIRLVVQTALQSPFFLYHVENVPLDGDKLVKLGPYELASRLSYFLWSSMPDDDLLEAARQGALDTPEGLRVQAERMLADDKAVDSIASFHLQWLRLTDLAHLTKDPDAFPSFDEAVTEAMEQETVRFADWVIRRGDAKLSTLLTSNQSFPSGPLYELYGVTAPEAQDPLEPIALDAQERSGLLTHASLLAQHAHGDQTSPIARGVLVRENVLCQTLPTPPENVNNTPPDPDPELTTRERFALHTEDPTCKACHQLIDGIGFGFENYDAIGRFQSEENGKSIDASGDIVGTEDIDGTFDGVVALSQILADSATVQSCMARQWFRFAFGRVESDGDAAQLDSLEEGFAESGFDIRELILSIVRSDAFRFRSTTPAEETSP